MKRYLFACVENAGRSQMAAAFFNLLADPNRAHAISAGTRPGAHVHPEVADAMREVGIDLSSVRPQKLTPELAGGVALLVTMGCGEECPFVPGARVEDWPLENPRGQLPAVVRRIRDEIRTRVEDLVRRDGVGYA
jgi:arsenate reductase